jgi:general L-amino acid transport system substrate-binding protein
MTFTPVIFEQQQEMVQAFANGRCDAVTQDASALSAHRLCLGAADYVILPELIGTEPLGGAAAKGDDQWFYIVRWVHFVSVMAEALSVDSSNIDTMKTLPNPPIRRLTGAEGISAANSA